MTIPFEAELRVARAAAIEAGEIALRYRASGVQPEDKSDGSPVTAADRECERRIVALLSEAFPDDGILGEEGAAREARSGRRWIIDPIDGTRDYVRGNPLWAVLIGLEAGGKVVAGVTYLPAQRDMFVATRGGGAYRNDTRIQVSTVSAPEQAVLCVNGLNKLPGKPYGEELLAWMPQFWAVRSFGGCYDAMLLAAGQVDVWFEPKAAPWDLAGPSIIIEEAGGRFFNMNGGSSIHGGDALACTPGLEAELRKRFVKG